VGDCSFVVEEAEAWILWAFTEAHQTIELSKTQKNIKNIDTISTQDAFNCRHFRQYHFQYIFTKIISSLNFVMNDFGWEWLVNSFYNKMMVRARFMYTLGFRDKKWVRWMIWG
jgi:hypothetical protein